MPVIEPILRENKNRFVIFPIQHHDIWQWYKKSGSQFLDRGRNRSSAGSFGLEQ